MIVIFTPEEIAVAKNQIDGIVKALNAVGAEVSRALYNDLMNDALKNLALSEIKHTQF